MPPGSPFPGLAAPSAGWQGPSSPPSCCLPRCGSLQLSSSCCRSKMCAQRHPDSDAAVSAPSYPGLHRAISQGLTCHEPPRPGPAALTRATGALLCFQRVAAGRPFSSELQGKAFTPTVKSQNSLGATSHCPPVLLTEPSTGGRCWSGCSAAGPGSPATPACSRCQQKGPRVDHSARAPSTS